MGQAESSLNFTLTNDLEAYADTSNADRSNVQIIINNIMYKVSRNLSADTSLNTFIRNVVKLKGTKLMCNEGGCGACIVAAEINGKVMAVNSCLIPIFICDGWKVVTIEGLGNKKTGYHTLQAALAEMNGSQCGFCSPGWVMNMFSLLQNGKMTMKEIENSFANNLCRCTGYRPILDTFKSFASDASPVMKEHIKDIEELYNVRSCQNCPKKICNGGCQDLEIIYKSSIPRALDIQLKDSTKFYKVLDIDSIFKIFATNLNTSYVINGGNTAHGVYRLPKKNIYIDVNDVPDLRRVEITKDALTLGGNITLSMAYMIFMKYRNEPGFEYFDEMAKHIDLVASIPIRNVGTIAGNLMIKNANNEFPSDIFLIFETAGALVHILESPSSKKSMTLLEFVNTNMEQKLLYSIVLPALRKEFVYNTFKIMPRAQNAHAIVNAGFLFKLNSNGTILEKPNIIFGGIRPDFFHATKTEEFSQGKSIFDLQSLQKILKTLHEELNPDYVLPDYKPEFRRLLATSLLYKFILSINPNKVSPKLRSGFTSLERGVSTAKQDYDIDQNLWPVNKPIPKIGSIHQTSGEGEYVPDIDIKHNEVFCALTLAEEPGEIKKIDFEEAMNIKGVIAFFSGKDVPGTNFFMIAKNNYPFNGLDEVLFADKEVTYAGQPYGIIAAKSQNIAQFAASKVKIIYPSGPKRKPIITIQDALASNDKTRILKIQEIPAQKPSGTDIEYTIKGSYETGPQYHFSMETQSCVCVPLEDGMDVFSATQWMDMTQTNVATVLGVPVNSINVKVRRLGGAYGCKISRAVQIACACALVCYKLNRPARLILSIEDNMKAIGKRISSRLEYNVSVNKEGKIQNLNGTHYGNAGSSFNESTALMAMYHFYNCYNGETWSLIGYDTKTDVPSNTWMRAPGSTEGISMVEHIMERIALTTGKDPLEVRILNINDADKPILIPMIDDIKKSSDYENRLLSVQKFNKENRWKKRGMSLIPMKYPLWILGQFHSLVAIYVRDGTVSISSAGIEMGQGLYTKIAQVAAHTFGIDINMITVKPSINWTCPNSFVTGGCLGSDTCGYATLMACKELLKRLEPIKEMLGGNPAWKDLLLKAYEQNVDLCASYMFTPNQPDVQTYPIYGVTVSEVEVDILTGQHLVHRVDIIEDAGISMNPAIDIGQIEGSFITGMGYWTHEDLIYNPETGGLTNYRTWNYKIPGAKDIPMDLRITLLRNAPNPLGILRSKATGEPPLCMACSIPIAIRNALNSARADAGNTDIWYQLDQTVTMEKILLNSLTTIEEMVL